MHKRWIALALLCAIFLSACAGEDPLSLTPSDISETQHQTAAETVSAAASAADAETVEAAFSHAIILIPGHTTVYIRGTAYTLDAAPFLHDGTLYVPAAAVAALMGGSFVQAGDFYYFNYMGNVSIVMEEYNVLLFNTDSVIMEKTPIVRDGVFYLPLSGLARALSVKYDKSPTQQIYLLGLQNSQSEAVFAALREKLTGESAQEILCPQIALLEAQYELDYDKIAHYAKQKTLWQTDDSGAIFNIWMDDGGALCSEQYAMSASFPESQLFYSEKGMLYSLQSGKEVCESAELLYQAELRTATGRYMELLAASQILGDEAARDLLSAYKEALQGDLQNESYLADLQNPHDTGIYDNATGEAAWSALLAQARAGDFLVFSASGAGAKYGFFNHSALILNVDQDAGCLHLLHARSSELGVGADLPMDQLTYCLLTENDYYKNYSTVYLCRAGELTHDGAMQMASDAYDTFNNYQFGYGGRLGLEETNCAELIVDSYSLAGVDILDEDYSSRLKEVLKGNTQNLVPIPDDLLLSGNVEVRAVWKK